MIIQWKGAHDLENDIFEFALVMGPALSMHSRRGIIRGPGKSGSGCLLSPSVLRQQSTFSDKEQPTDHFLGRGRQHFDVRRKRRDRSKEDASPGWGNCYCAYLICLPSMALLLPARAPPSCPNYSSTLDTLSQNARNL